MTQSKKFAVTGGIGSGKSTFCEILNRRGYLVLSCDEISRALWQEKAYREELAMLFPSCTNSGEIDKIALSRLVFSDEDARRKLDNFSHPRIMQELVSRMETEPISFAEVPLLFEGGYEGLFDGVILLKREESARIKAVSVRDGLSEEDIRARIQAQFHGDPQQSSHIFIVENNGSLSELEEAATRAADFFGIG